MKYQKVLPEVRLDLESLIHFVSSKRKMIGDQITISNRIKSEAKKKTLGILSKNHRNNQVVPLLKLEQLRNNDTMQLTDYSQVAKAQEANIESPKAASESASVNKAVLYSENSLQQLFQSMDRSKREDSLVLTKGGSQLSVMLKNTAKKNLNNLSTFAAGHRKRQQIQKWQGTNDTQVFKNNDSHFLSSKDISMIGGPVGAGISPIK